MQNLIVLIKPSVEPWDDSWKAGNMCLNRFCIDENASFELSGIYSFQKSGLNDVEGMEFYFPNIQIS